jgi:GT2 family glycosyltransferase
VKASAVDDDLAQVSVVVVLHNSAQVVERCMTALPAEVEVIVVDNESSDGGAAIAARARPDASVIRSENNLGFGRGCEAGANAATRPVLLFLNPDAEIGAAAIRTLTGTLIRHPRAVVGPRLLDVAGQTRLLRAELDMRKDALWLLPASQRWIPSSWRRQPETRVDIERQVLYVEGACFLVRRADLQAAGGFDPDLFLYFEESSLAHRLKQLGGGAWYEPRALATHIGQASTSKRDRFCAFHFYRSRVIFERKTVGDRKGRLRTLPLLGAALVALLNAAVQQLIGRRPGAVLDAVAVMRGAIAGVTDRIGPTY